MLIRLSLIVFSLAFTAFSQNLPPIEPGVSQELAKWRAARYSDIRYKLNLTLEKMSPVLKGTIEIRVKVSEPGAVATGSVPPIILDWRKIKGHETLSTISNVSINGIAVKNPVATAPGSDPEHLIFRDGVVAGENVIKLDFTSPILTSGSAITRYIDKEDGSEYIYSLFVPSDASMAFPVFDQPDLKARFSLQITVGGGRNHPTWQAISNSEPEFAFDSTWAAVYKFRETPPISTYVFAFAIGDFEPVRESTFSKELTRFPVRRISAEPDDDVIQKDNVATQSIKFRDEGAKIYVRKSQAAKFKPHAAEVFRLNREAIKYFEQYFDYKFPFPKCDLVLIPEFPFGGMEHAGATFLRESSIIFPQEPTRSDHISRALLIFHEASHQWFGDTVTMRWFDDLWLKEGFATFTAYKALEKIMPEMNAWKVFYERVKQAAYQTDSTKGTTAIYQPIANLSAAKSAYGNIVYNKAPAFLRQAEFYLGERDFRSAVRTFLKKNEFANAGWSDLVNEFKKASLVSMRRGAGYGSITNDQKIKYEAQMNDAIDSWAEFWVQRPGVLVFRYEVLPGKPYRGALFVVNNAPQISFMADKQTEKIQSGFVVQTFVRIKYGTEVVTQKLAVPTKELVSLASPKDFFRSRIRVGEFITPDYVFPNDEDFGYGIFLLDQKSRDHVLKNIQNEKDPFLRSMMWGALWDSVREGELDPRVYVELAIKNLPTEKDETMVSSILSRVSTAMNYYVSDASRAKLAPRFEALLIEGMQKSSTLGQRITFYRAFLSIAASENARTVLKAMLKSGPPAFLPLKTKDRFDIVTRLLILSDADGPKLLAELEKTETSDDAKRYAFAARAGIPTAENKAKYWNDFVNNKDISESWIEAAFGPWNSTRHSELTLPYLQRALQELPNHKRARKIFFVNGWLGAFIGGQRSEEALAVVNKFLADNPNLDNDLRLKILENVDTIERAVKIRKKFRHE